MRDTHLPLKESAATRDNRRRAVQEYRRFPGGIVADLDIPPANRANAGAKRFGGRFLGRKSHREHRNTTGGVRPLIRSVHPREEPLAVPSDRRGDARNLDDIYTNREGWIAGSTK